MAVLLPHIPAFQAVDGFPKAWPKDGACNDRGWSAAAIPVPDPRLPNRFLVWDTDVSAGGRLLLSAAVKVGCLLTVDVMLLFARSKRVVLGYQIIDGI